MSRSAKSIFEEVCELGPHDRQSKLDELCGHDQALRDEVTSLLSSLSSAGEFLNEPTMDYTDGDATDAVAISGQVSLSEGPGSVVDRYKLLEKIGEGGFGVVYMAQQSEPVRRRVALKIIKLGMDTKQVVARFEAERQALAIMDHPNIARVIDGGSTETGRPYFVMELVRGNPITEYCDERKLSLRERLALFQQVCRAIEHAHQKGIIHRDIKPSNVLVTIADDKPLVKVIDFGIAKATSSELTEKTLFTQFRQLVGTPLYMSPEQAERSGVDVDTRTDIYSLGVLLYEILTGKTPLDPKKLNSAAWAELQRMIVDEEPSKPSILVSSAIGEMSEVAKARATDPGRLGNLLRGDLDWIVLKALEKERSRRYGSASQFADDIQRFLDDEAVEATPPSKLYRFRKFARRNRGLLATGAAILLTLVVGLIGTSLSAAWAMKAQRDANEAFELAQKRAKSARRAATLAGSSTMLPEADARALAASWEIEIAELEQAGGHAAATKLRTQYTTWFAIWLMQHEKASEGADLAAACYEDAKNILGVKEPAFLALCNARLQLMELTQGDRKVNADIFDDWMESNTAIHGAEKSGALAIEHAGALAQAERFEEATKAVRRYLKYRETMKEPATSLDHVRLEMQMNRLLKWGAEEPELVAQLQAIRDMGSAKDAVEGEDEGLRNDLKMMQGTWVYKREQGGKVVEHMEVQFKENLTTTYFYQDGMKDDGRAGHMELTRSGPVKFLTIYLGNYRIGAVFIYQITADELTIVSGMASAKSAVNDIRMQRLKRVK